MRKTLGLSHAKASRGIPIGNLTSQIFSNIYLNEFDRFVRHTLKPQAYLRYGDDFILFAATRHQARSYRTASQDFLQKSLKLRINPRNDVVIAASAGLHFLGHVITTGYVMVDKHTTKSVLRKLNSQNIHSYKSLKLVAAARKELDWLMVEEISQALDK